MNKHKSVIIRRRILHFLNSANNGLGFNELVSKLNQRKVSAFYYDAASRPTVSASLKELQQDGHVQRDVGTRKYKITAGGKKYAKLSEIVDCILSSTKLDSVFDWSAEREKEKTEEISAAYMLATCKKDSGEHALAILHEKLKRTKPMLWDFDIVTYAIETEMLNDKDVGNFKKAVEGKASVEELAAILRKLKAVGKRLFKGVERLTIVEMVNPQLSLENLKKKLQEVNGLSEPSKAL